jgi:hypothetical protein
MNYQVRQYNYISNKFKVIFEFGASSQRNAINFVDSDTWYHFIDKESYSSNTYFTLVLDSAIKVFKLPGGHI